MTALPSSPWGPRRTETAIRVSPTAKPPTSTHTPSSSDYELVIRYELTLLVLILCFKIYLRIKTLKNPSPPLSISILTNISLITRINNTYMPQNKYHETFSTANKTMFSCFPHSSRLGRSQIGKATLEVVVAPQGLAYPWSKTTQVAGLGLLQINKRGKLADYKRHCALSFWTKISWIFYVGCPRLSSITDAACARRFFHPTYGHR